MNYAVEFANQLRKRDNIEPSETVVGEVISINPITVSLFNGQAIFTEGEKLHICESLKTITGTITIDNQEKSFSIKRELNIGNKVVCIPFSNGQKYMVIDKI